MRGNELHIRETESIKDALKKLDRTAEKVLLVVDSSGRLLGAISDGDVRRYILSGRSLEGDIAGIYNKKPLYLRKDDFTLEQARKTLLKNKVELVPIVDGKDKVVDFITWSQAFSENGIKKIAVKPRKLDVPVVIMAGGRGTRLEPFSKILPKPLVPVGDKPIIELIIDNFRGCGIREYFIVLNYKGDMVRSYLDNVEDKDYATKYIIEEEYLGTVGGLKLIGKDLGDTFIVSNCDVMVRADMAEVVKFHKEKKAVLTALSSIQHHVVPYGVVSFREGGEVINIHEKPEYTFTINTGVYVLDRSALSRIPDRTNFDMTDLIAKLIHEKDKVVTYPVNENDYIDIGRWEEYKKAIGKFHAFLGEGGTNV